MKKNASDEKSGTGIYRRIIFLAIDDYDDLFSDFDNRAFGERTVSDDFVYELKKLSTENRLAVDEIRLEMPERKRKHDVEASIRQRIHSYLKANEQVLEVEMRKRKTKGLIFLFSGLVLLFISSLLLNRNTDAYLQRLLLVTLEPSGWFFTWSGMDILFLRNSEDKKEEEFFRKISGCKISFHSPEHKS